MKIDIKEYVNDEEIKTAILDGLKGYAASNAERVISNAGHFLASSVVDEKLGDNAKDEIAAKALEVISQLSPFTLFDPGGYGQPASGARKALDQCVIENKDDLSKAVKIAMHNLSKRDLIGLIKDGKFKMVVE